MLNLPNFLTLLRIVAIPIFLILLTDGQFGFALFVFVAAGVTDALDGTIARLMNTRTTLGAYMDPLADKMLLLSAFVVLAFMGAVPPWLTVVVITRDVLIVGGFLMLFLMTQRSMEIRPSAASKASTFFQLCTLSLVLLSRWRPETLPPVTLVVVFGVTGVVTALSGVQYMARGLRWYQQITAEG